LLARKCGFIGVFTNGILFYLENLTGESHQSTPYFIPQYSRYNSEQSTLGCLYHEIAIKTVDLDRTVFGIYRTTFCNQHDHWGDNSRTLKT
jgi:hypothetical protein